MSCASFITHALPMPCGTPGASPELVDSSWKFPHQLFAPPPTWDRAPGYNQPKVTEPGSGSGSRSIYDVLSQSWPVLSSELRKPSALVSGATGICIWKKGRASPPVPHHGCAPDPRSPSFCSFVLVWSLNLGWGMKKIF